MKQFFFVMLVVFANSAIMAQNPADKITGVWLNEDKTTKIEIVKTGNTYLGKIVWLAQPNDVNGNPRLDKNNPDLEKRHQKILGLTILSGISYSKNTWTGTLYGPKRGQYAECSIVIDAASQLQITVSKGFFSETKIWTKP